ncbi:MAG: hypothetical protein AAFQ23_02790, partial [Cyanobacteria bacterium J06623_1]
FFVFILHKIAYKRTIYNLQINIALRLCIEAFSTFYLLPFTYEQSHQKPFISYTLRSKQWSI